MFQSRCQDSWGCDLFPLIAAFFFGAFQSRCQDSWGCDVATMSGYARIWWCFSPVARIHGVATQNFEGRWGDRQEVSVPLPGFMGLRHFRRSLPNHRFLCFSPVARIHGVATFEGILASGGDSMFQSRCQDSWGCDIDLVARPPIAKASFSPVARIHGVATLLSRRVDFLLKYCFSPVARIHGVATQSPVRPDSNSESFSPVARIHGVATDNHATPASQFRVSVPLPGFMGLRPGASSPIQTVGTKFQSRCQDSWGCDLFPARCERDQNGFQSRCQDSWGCDFLMII